MSDQIDFEPLQDDAAATAVAETAEATSAVEAFFSDDLDRLRHVPVELSVEIGRTRMTLGETLGLVPGSIVTLDRTAGEPVDLLVNGRRIARGEVVVVDDEFGVRLTEVIGDSSH